MDTKLVHRGQFITFEGIDGSGKSTQIQRLAQWLQNKNIEVLCTREPGATELGKQLRKYLLEEIIEILPMSEMLLFIADRVEHLERVIIPALNQGTWVLSDRFIDSTIAYQGYARGINVPWIQKIHQIHPLSIIPDQIILLDLEVEKAYDRMKNRPLDKIEKESKDFLNQVRLGFLKLAQNSSIHQVISADQSIDCIEMEIVQCINLLLRKNYESS